MEYLSKEQARKMVLHAQRLPPGKQTGSAIDATLTAIEHLGYVQIDTISAVQRAHHHVLWSRNPRYKLPHLDQLIEDKQVFEYWTHAAAYLPMRDYRFSLLRKQAIESGEQEHWFKRDQQLMNDVRDRISAEGPLMARDFEHRGKKIGEWGSKPAKQALENLFIQGELMISRRVNFHKVYDLTERVVPAGVDRRVPTREEHARFLIFQYLEANGLGQPMEIAYLRKNIKPLISATVQEMVASAELQEVNVGKNIYHVLPASLALLNKPLSRRKLKILSPFDNLLIQRKRMKDLFDFDYQLECYLPETKRRFGYFVLPVLWDGRFVARMDCKADRKTFTLHVQHLALEPELTKMDAFIQALEKEMADCMRFNNCSHLRIHKTTPGNLHSISQRLEI